jgi:CheY-like chemotaxis protein
MDDPAQHENPVTTALPLQRAAPPSSVRSPALRVVLADDTPDMLTLLRLTFDFHEGTDVCGVARDGAEALELWRTHRPDVVVMDLRMPVLSGLEAAARILVEDPGQLVAIFSAAFRQVDYQLADAIGVVRCFDKRDMDRLPQLVHALGSRVSQD